jgi:glycosyltransferase involved in cell wall biosynthesis
MNVLITDLNIALDGHKLGFVQNTINYISQNKNKHRFYILVNNSSTFKLSDPRKEWISIEYLSTEEQGSIDSQTGFLKKAAAQWKCIKSFAKQHNIKHLVLMELDPYQLEIGKAKTPFTIGGIWFRPYARMLPETNTFKARQKNRIIRLQKAATMKFALSNSKLKQVFILNDENMPNWLNGSKKRYFHLPDPWFAYQKLENYKLRELFDIPEDNVVFLQFGFIDERKNTENIILALNSLPAEVAKKVSLLIVGKFKPDYEVELKNLKNTTSKYQIKTKNEFVSDEEMEAIFSQSDVIIRMNLNFYGSSGIVGIAAVHHKPVIVSDKGVMAEQVEKYKLGKLANPVDRKEIAQVISEFVNEPKLREISGKGYLDSHTVAKFAETLLQIP